MQVARAGKVGQTTRLAAPRDEAYAPLYLKSVLGNTAFDIDELEELALSRLRLLRTIGEAGNVSQNPEAADALRRAEREHGFHIPPPGNPGRKDVIVRDQAAHFLVRLALCTCLEDRQWFLSRECTLFSIRLERAGTEFALARIRAAKGPDIKPVAPDVLQSLRPDLEAVARSSRASLGDVNQPYYQVAFEQVPAQVRLRRVVIRAGEAYIPERFVQDIVASQFRSLLNGALLTALKGASLVDSDPRMKKIMFKIRENHAAVSTKADFDTDGLAVDRINLNQLEDSLKAMPLCMLNMMNKLRIDHHMRHGGRMQLGVFLKGCGLTMDESLRFWRDEFSKAGMPGDKFDKQYAYNIRHHYGKEGKRTNLTPFSCMKIINNRPGPGEHHGCPYREFEQNRLRDTLRSVGTSSEAIPSIVAKAAEGNFQGACGLCFAATQPGPHDKNEAGMPVYFPEHPNDYFIQARRHQRGPDGPSLAEIDKDEEEMHADVTLPETGIETPEKSQTKPGSPLASSKEATVANQEEGNGGGSSEAGGRELSCSNGDLEDTGDNSKKLVSSSQLGREVEGQAPGAVDGSPPERIAEVNPPTVGDRDEESAKQVAEARAGQAGASQEKVNTNVQQKPADAAEAEAAPGGHLDKADSLLHEVDGDEKPAKRLKVHGATALTVDEIDGDIDANRPEV